MTLNLSQDPRHDESATMELRSHAHGGAGWFYWIAALSVITSIISLTGGQWGFAIALGFTQVVDAIAAGIAGDLGIGAKIAVFLFDAIAAGIFFLFGVLSMRGQNWAYILGTVLYALDGLLFLFAQDWVGLGFHAFALFFMVRGLMASLKLAKLPPAPQPTTVRADTAGVEGSVSE